MSCEPVNRRFRVGLRTRVTMWTTAVLVVSLVAGLIWARHNVRRVLEAKNDSFLDRKIAEVRAAARDSHDGDGELNAEIRREVAAYRDEGLVVVVRRAGKVEVTPADANGHQIASRCAALPADDFPTDIELESGQRYRVLNRPMNGASIVVALSLADTEHTLAQLDRRVATGAAAFVVVAIIGGMLLSRQVLRPVAESIEQAKQLNPSDLSARLPLTGAGDELDVLATTINRLLDRLALYHAQMIQFTADASHELRSPLAVMRAAIEVAVHESRTAAQYQDLLGSLAEQCDQLSTLVNELLLLAQADAGQVAIRREPVDLTALAVETAELYEPLAGDQGISLTCVGSKPVVILGDRDRLRQLLSNLVDNAIKFTKTGGHVKIDTSTEGPNASVVVADTGCGIPADRLPHIFDRFYRVDAARSGDGFGLGLSICAWIAAAHHGTINVVESSPRGTTFAVILPTANAEL
jgi:heavy metal sensor kinase